MAAARAALGRELLLMLLTSFAAEPELREDACSALVKVAGHDVSGLSTEQRRTALQLAADESKNDTTKKRARELLKEAK